MKKLTLIIIAITVLFSGILMSPAMAADSPAFQMKAKTCGLCAPYFYVNFKFLGGFPVILARDIWLVGIGLEDIESDAIFFLTPSQISYINIHRFSSPEEDFCLVPETSADGQCSIIQAFDTNPGERFKITVVSNEGKVFQFPFDLKDLQPLINTSGGWINRNGEFVVSP